MEQIISQGIVAIGVLVALTNIITEVIKLNFKVKGANSINVIATVVAICLTLVAGFAYAQINGFILEWYHIFALLIGGFLVALASMLGFDKLLSYFEGIKGVR